MIAVRPRVTVLPSLSTASARCAAVNGRRTTTTLNHSSVVGSARMMSHLAKRTTGSFVSLNVTRSFHATSLSSEAETIKVPSMAESITEGTLKQWLKKEGDYVEADEEVATIETDKIDVSVNAPKAGTITELLAAEEDTVAVGQDLFKLEAGEGSAGGSRAATSQPEADKKEEKEKQSSGESSDKGGKASSKETEKDSTNEAKKKETKTSEEDSPKPSPTKKAKEEGAAPAKESKEPTAKPPKQPEPKSSKSAEKEEPKKEKVAGSRGETRVKMSRMRARIAERLKQSQNAAAALTTFNEIDMSSLMSMRSAYKDGVLKDHGVKLGFMSAFAKASCIALQEIPAANASIEGEGNDAQIIYRDYVDLSVAVATPKGLVTPVLRNAEQMNFVEFEKAIAEMGKKARDNKITLEDMAGGSFTISNGGVFGSLYGTPIINLPQCAVLGMHSIKDKAVVVDGKIVIRPIMVVALTYDHRLLDGREAVTFLVRIKDLIEDPRRMLLA